MVVATEAKCLRSGSFNAGFNSFIQQCISPSDIGRSRNIIKADDIVTIFENEQAASLDLLTTFNGIEKLRDSSDVSQGTLNNLNTQLDNIKNKIDEIDSQIEVENQKFLTNVTTAPKKTSYLGNLQDIALGLFFFSLIIITIILSFIQYSKPEGSFKAAAYTFLGMVIAIVVIYGLLKEIA